MSFSTCWGALSLLLASTVMLASHTAVDAQEVAAKPQPGEAEAKLKPVQVGAITLQVPESWTVGEPTSRMRLAEFTLPGRKPTATDDDSQGGSATELVVFYFGGGPAGGIAANVERWTGQFHPQGRQVNTVRGAWRDGTYVWVDITGTWKKPDGPPFAQKSIDQPGSRVISVIVIVEKEGTEKDHYFLKLSGPDDVVQGHADDLRRAIAATPGSEKPFDDTASGK